MTADEKRAVAREASILRSFAGGNRVALSVAHRLIGMVGGEAEVAFPASMRDDPVRQAMDDAGITCLVRG